MGTLRHPPVADFLLAYKAKYPLRTLVETGTYKGDSTSWAARHFENVFSIDIRANDRADAFAALCNEELPSHHQVRLFLGDSKDVLPTIVPITQRPAAYWLDAHNAINLFGDRPDDCPLMAELDVIFQHDDAACILIDDAHCYTPPLPYDPKVWPTLRQIEDRARKAGYLFGNQHDVLVIAPPFASDLMRTHGWL
jgi:hypothetical protein